MVGLEFLLAEPGSSDGLVEPFLGVNSANLQRCFGAEDQQNHKNISKNGNVAGIVSDMYRIHLHQSPFQFFMIMYNFFSFHRY